jgi:hypothetical protein
MEQDSPWKEALEEFFEEFMENFFPDIYKEIDFSKGYEFLDQELQQIAVSSETGKRVVDKLVKVYLIDGSEEWLLIHIEIQGYEQEEFPDRMYIYNYRILDKFRKEVVSLALLTDDNPNFRPNEYQRSRWGCNLLFQYPVVKVIDYRERWAELESSSNPFAIIVCAYLKTLETEGNVQERYKWKKRFLLELYQRGMEREVILKVYKFIDWIMTLPKGLNKEIHTAVKSIEEAQKMPYITTAEQIGREEGLAQGLAQGLAAILEIKFGEAGQRLGERAHQIEDFETLKSMMAKLKGIKSLSEAEKLFDELGLPTA